MAAVIVVSRSNGTMKHTPATFPCQATLTVRYNTLPIVLLQSPNIHHTFGKTGAKVQRASNDEGAILVDATDSKRVQEVLGTLLYYLRAVDCTMLAAIASIGASQASATSATKTTMEEITHLLNYCATHRDAVLHYHARDMVLHTDSDAAYLVAQSTVTCRQLPLPQQRACQAWTTFSRRSAFTHQRSHRRPLQYHARTFIHCLWS
jgi:hypothetical protein